VIQEFIGSWTLFHNTYLVGWLIGLLLAQIGVLVVARDQIFIGAAVSQASTLGIALALGLGSWAATEALKWLHADAFLSAMAVLFAILAALLTARGREDGRESHEAVTGWVFLVSASGAILIVSHSPHGLDEIHRLLSSSIIGATSRDIWVFSVLVIMTVVALIVTRQRVLLFTLDPAMAAAVGMRLKLWALVISGWLGLAVGLSIRSAGMLYTFGCLVLPALVAKNLCREVRSMFVVSSLVAVGTGTLGFVLANHFDDPPAQMTVALLCLLLTIAWPIGRLRRSRAAG
jgi:ABC-type Mn2+/Zn2+ transport system permease subunit